MNLNLAPKDMLLAASTVGTVGASSAAASNSASVVRDNEIKKEGKAWHINTCLTNIATYFAAHLNHIEKKNLPNNEQPDSRARDTLGGGRNILNKEECKNLGIYIKNLN